MSKNVEFLKNRIDALNKRLADNAISDEARAEIEKNIAGLRNAADELENLRNAAADGTEDNSEQMLSQMRELMSRISSLEKEVGDAVSNSKKPVKANATKAFADKFLEVVRNSFSRAEFIENRKALVKNADADNYGYSTISDWLPAAVLQEVTDTFSNRHRLLELVTWTGLPVWLSKVETGGDIAKDYSGIGEKTPQEVEFESVEIRPKYVYKYFTCPQEIERETRDNGGQFVRFIVRELLDRVLYKVESNICLGTSSGSFIAPTAATIVTDANSVPQYHAMNYMPYVDSRDLVAIVKPSLYIQLKQQMLATYGYYVTDEFIARDFFGVNEVVIMPEGVEANLPANSAGLMFMDYRSYKMVGDRRPDEFEDFNLAFNRKEYLTEMWIGGGETRFFDAAGTATQAFINIVTA